MAWWVSWALSILGATGIFLTERKKWYGFAVGIVNECAWVAYSINTKQWGFIFGAAAYIIGYAMGIKEWREDERAWINKYRITVNIFGRHKV